MLTLPDWLSTYLGFGIALAITLTWNRARVRRQFEDRGIRLTTARATALVLTGILFWPVIILAPAVKALKGQRQ